MKSLLKCLCLAIPVLLSQPIWAHDEGHGPKLSDPAKYGGRVAPVILKSEVAMGPDATMHFKAEVTKNSSGKLRIYLYDKTMKPLNKMKYQDLSGVIYFRNQRTGKGAQSVIDVVQKESEVTAQLPSAVKGRFDFDFTFQTQEGTYFVAFDGMR